MQYSLAILALAAAATANPMAQLVARQAVTASIAPSDPPPPGCTGSAAGSYGIVVHNVSTSAAPAKRQAGQTSGVPSQITHGAVSMINDGQIQAGFQTKVMMPIANQITDGQIQVQVIMAPVTETVDGQPQAPTVSTSSSTVVATSTPVPTIAAPATPAAPKTSAAVSSAPSAVSSAPSAVSSTPSAVSSAPAASSSASSMKMIACEEPGELEITLDNGILKDAKGRTGYIASNFQFQFDGPPQAGAIYTAGFSVCGNQSLALGGSNVFYQCLSGSFYNLYDRPWAAQCYPITISTLELQKC